jgi:hypothetical protein
LLLLFCFDCSQLKQTTYESPATRDLANCRAFLKGLPLVVRGRSAKHFSWLIPEVPKQQGYHYFSISFAAVTI